MDEHLLNLSAEEKVGLAKQLLAAALDELPQYSIAAQCLFDVNRLHQLVSNRQPEQIAPVKSPYKKKVK